MGRCSALAGRWCRHCLRRHTGFVWDVWQVAECALCDRGGRRAVHGSLSERRLRVSCGLTGRLPLPLSSERASNPRAAAPARSRSVPAPPAVAPCPGRRGRTHATAPQLCTCCAVRDRSWCCGPAGVDCRKSQRGRRARRRAAAKQLPCPDDALTPAGARFRREQTRARRRVGLWRGNAAGLRVTRITHVRYKTGQQVRPAQRSGPPCGLVSWPGACHPRRQHISLFDSSRQHPCITAGECCLRRSAGSTQMQVRNTGRLLSRCNAVLCSSLSPGFGRWRLRPVGAALCEQSPNDPCIAGLPSLLSARVRRPHMLRRHEELRHAAARYAARTAPHCAPR